MRTAIGFVIAVSLAVVAGEAAAQDTNPSMGPCAGDQAEAWVGVFRSTGAGWLGPDQCKMVPPNSRYPNLFASGHTWPDGTPMNDNLRSFSAFVRAGKCLSVRMYQHPNYTGNVIDRWSCPWGAGVFLNVSEHDIAANFGVTSIAIDWWWQ